MLLLTPPAYTAVHCVRHPGTASHRHLSGVGIGGFEPPSSRPPAERASPAPYPETVPGPSVAITSWSPARYCRSALASPCCGCACPFLSPRQVQGRSWGGARAARPSRPGHLQATAVLRFSRPPAMGTRPTALRRSWNRTRFSPWEGGSTILPSTRSRVPDFTPLSRPRRFVRPGLVSRALRSFGACASAQAARRDSRSRTGGLLHPKQALFR